MDTQFTTSIALDRDTFMRRLISSLGYLNEGILGSDVAGAYVMNVGLSMGAAIEAEYKKYWGIDRPFTLDEYAHVIVDLKQKIKGNFSLVEKDADKVIVQTTSCPFDEFVRQSPSLCFMTSSVFGGIAARNFGYAKTVLHKRIALGDPGCYVTVYLRRTPEAETMLGKEYYPEVERASPDITEQLRLMESIRNLQHQLTESSARWTELAQGATEAFLVVGADGHIEFANARWRELLGVEGQELIGSPFDLAVHLDDQTSARTALAQALRGQRVTGQDLRLKQHDGEWSDVVAGFGPIRDELGRISSVLAIFRDVTEEREAQRLKDNLLNVASHELRTPVTTIKGLTEILLRTLEAQGAIDPGQLARRLKTIQSAADRLAMLSADMIEVARLQAGTLPVRPLVIDLNTLAAEVVENYIEQTQGLTHHEIILQRAEEPLLVCAERHRIQQVFTNLLNNAVKYSPYGGLITITVEARDGKGQVRVADEGIGIPEQDLPQLFTPFYRASNASAAHFAGLGFGLYLSQEIVRAHAGDLTVTSVEGVGSTFTFTLPLVDRGEHGSHEQLDTPC